MPGIWSKLRERRVLIGLGIALVLLMLILAGLLTARWYLRHQRALRNAAASSLRKPDVQVTIIEGKRREEVAQQLAAAGVCPYADFMQASAGKEGTLFPDTYRFFPGTPAADVVAAMTDDYARRIAAAGLHPTAGQLVLASIVEREAENDADRPAIAGVYQNRLDIGMRLQSDPTVQYGKDTNLGAGNPAYKYWAEITAADYTGVDSPYNTYEIDALPPGPICNPGLKSIEAAISPAHHLYYFFLYKDDQLKLAKTLQEHLNQE